jgi:hypothetical protein
VVVVEEEVVEWWSAKTARVKSRTHVFVWQGR